MLEFLEKKLEEQYGLEIKNQIFFQFLNSHIIYYYLYLKLKSIRQINFYNHYIMYNFRHKDFKVKILTSLCFLLL